MRTKLQMLAAVMLTAAMIFSAAPAAAQGIEGGGDDDPVGVVKQADGKKFKFPLKGYVIGGVFCSAAGNMLDAVVTDAIEQRQLTSKKAIANTIGCFTFGIGRYVYLALNPESPADIYAARVAWLYDRLPARREQFFADVIGDRKAWSYPPIAQMLKELRAAGIKVSLAN